MEMAKPSSGVPYPERFYVAAAYAGFGDRAKLGNFSRFENDVALMLYGLHRQVRQKYRSRSGGLFAEISEWKESNLISRLDRIGFGDLYGGMRWDE